MSTRAAIGRKTANGFTGVYHHWDGYPSGLGATLFELRNGYFKGDTLAMLKMLIDDHPQGWSTINGADFNLPAAPRTDHNKQLCQDCYRPIWAHFRQYYQEGCNYWTEAGRPPIPPNSPVEGYKLFPCSGHPIDSPHGPECFGGNEPGGVTQDDAQNCGCEYAYAFEGDKMHVLSSFRENGDKMIGMFGCGDPDAKWKTIAIVDLNGSMPDWKTIEAQEAA